MQNIINEYIGGLKLGRKQYYKNMTVFALLSDYNANSDYLTLDEALSGNFNRRGRKGRRWFSSGAQGGSTNRTGWS